MEKCLIFNTRTRTYMYMHVFIFACTLTYIHTHYTDIYMSVWYWVCMTLFITIQQMRVSALVTVLYKYCLLGIPDIFYLVYPSCLSLWNWTNSVLSRLHSCPLNCCASAWQKLPGSSGRALCVFSIFSVPLMSTAMWIWAVWGSFLLCTEIT